MEKVPHHFSLYIYIDRAYLDEMQGRNSSLRSGEAVEWVAQRSSGYLSPESVQGHVGLGFEQTL